MVYRTMPWIGIYASNLRRTRRTNIYLLLAFFCFLVLFLILPEIDLIIWELLFRSNDPLQIEEVLQYYFYLLLMESLILIFARTRISIYYLPKLITIMNVLTLYYCFISFFPFFHLAFNLLFLFACSLILLFMRLFELSGTEWNPFSLHAPGINNPRQVYIHTARSTFSISFDLYSLFMPVRLRSEFDPEEQREIGAAVNPIQFDFSNSPIELPHQ